VKIFFTPRRPSFQSITEGPVAFAFAHLGSHRAASVPNRAAFQATVMGAPIHATARRWAAHAAGVGVSASLIDMDPSSIGHRRLLENLRRPMRPECA
jgi:hypothetical protein